MAELFMDALIKSRPPTTREEILMYEKDKLCVQIAGLCLNLGHGPFSYVWVEFLPETLINFIM